jgi:hypothetical protein
MRGGPIVRLTRLCVPTYRNEPLQSEGRRNEASPGVELPYPVKGLHPIVTNLIYLEGADAFGCGIVR